MVIDFLSPELQARLLAAARQARAHAYAPYSKFLVGAAVLDDKGRIHAGCNVENAAFPQGVCAEAGALSAMVLAGSTRVAAVAVVAQVAAGAARTARTEIGAGDRWVTPCGGCRQKLREFAAPATPVLIASPHHLNATLTMEQLLPHSFGPENLDPA